MPAEESVEPACAPFAWDAAAWADGVEERCAEPFDCLLVLAGGVDEAGAVHATVARRLDAAAELYRRARRKGRQLHIITNGGGTSHKPRWRDAHGYSVPEAQLMAEGLRERGVALTHVVLEGLSDDTIGNAFCARASHLEWRSDWRSLLLITSDFQLPRAEAVYRWVLALEPKKEYALCVAGVPDSGTMDAEAQASRAQRECASLRAFLVGVGAVYSSMEQVQSWMFSTHDAYAPRSKPRATLDAATLKTY